MRPSISLGFRSRGATRLIVAICLGWFAVSHSAAAAWEDAIKSPLEPDESLRHLQVFPGLRVELVACEPQVVDPVAIRFDETGRMWVVEMGDYPNGPAEGEPPRSRIKVLQDRDGDGRFETATVFAGGLLFATGIQPWRGGVIATIAGQVVYLQDTDGDGRADKHEVWYTGFIQENPQLRANHPYLGHDNQVYVANGLRGGAVVDARRPDVPAVSISGMDFCFDPLSSEFEALTGVGQFGLTFDDAGNRFVCSNRNPVLQIVIENRYLKRNPRAAVRAASNDVARAAEQSRIFPISRAWTTSNLHAGQFTAACGVTIYRGDALPNEFRGNAFTCDPTGNLVHREILTKKGGSFVSQPDREGVEFLASPDEWFRPVNLENGPDGALYVVDMYRAVIEHPQFVPDELKHRPDERYGDDRGRIYRVLPDRTRRESGPVTLAHATTAELVSHLASSNAWWRETAARLLLERQDPAAAQPLSDLIGKQDVGASAGPAVSRALWLLDGLGQLQESHLLTGVNHALPEARRQALILWDSRFPASDTLRRAVLDRPLDSDPHVRMQVALSLTPIADEPRAIELLAQTAIECEGDVWTQNAVAVAAGQQSAAVLRKIVQSPEVVEQPARIVQLAPLVADLVGVAAATDRDSAVAALAALLDPPLTTAAEARSCLAQAIVRFAQRQSPFALRGELDRQRQQALDQLFQSAAATARDAMLSDVARAEATGLLVLDPGSTDTLTHLALEETVQAVRLRAIGGLAGRAASEPWAALLRRFAGESPAVRGAILDGVLASPQRVAMLLDEIAAKRVKSSEIDRIRADRLAKHPDAALRERANQLLADAIPADRHKVLVEYRTVLGMASNPVRGREIFAKQCATCHRVGDVGVDVAPDISDSRTKTAEQILTDVIQPNRAIDNNYVSYTAVTEAGQILTGILSAETATSVTLKQPEGKVATLLRTEIAELRSNGISLMPDGLEKNIPLQDMADVISYVKNWRYLDGKTPYQK